MSYQKIYDRLTGNFRRLLIQKMEFPCNLSLRSMEEDNIITRTVCPEAPPHVEYALSELGESMRPILNAMYQWDEEYRNAL